MFDSSPAKNRFEVLDSFRGICAICVVFFHMTIINGLATLTFFKGSAIFVEFFFVLSGFVLSHGFAYKDNLNFKGYIAARFFRIYPLHIFTLAIMIFLECGKVVAEKYGVVFQIHSFTLTKDVSEILPNLFLVQAWTHLTQNASFNGPAWSISIEFYTYIIFFVTLLFSWKCRVIAWCMISLSAFLAIAYEFPYITSNVARGLSCFFLGSLSYALIRFICNKQNLGNNSYGIFTFLEFAMLAIIYALVTSDIEYRSIILSVLFAICISMFSLQKGLVSKILSAAPFTLVGKLSYSIYMIHAAIILVITSVFIVAQKVTGIELTKIVSEGRVIDTGSTYMNTALAILTITAVVISSIFTYKYIEEPFIKIGKKIQSKRVVQQGPACRQTD